MKSHWLILLMVLTLVCLALLARAAEKSVSFFVAVNGNDYNPGTKAKPFATLERARDEIRRMKAAGPLPAGGVTVEMAGGIYERSTPFELTEADAGTEKSPIVYRARRGEEVRLMGGRGVTGWHPVTDPAVLARMDPAARGQVLQADLRVLGITNYGSMRTGAPSAIEQKVFSPYSPGLELFFNDQPMTLARWPNEGFTKVGDLLGNAPWDFQGLKGDSIGKFTYEGDRPARWVQEKDVMLHGYWAWDWSDQRCKVESIDPVNRFIAMESPYHSCGYRKGQRYYAYNLLPELDAPGEWWLDRDAGILNFWPPSPIASGRAIVSVLPSLVTMRQTAHLTLRGMTLEAAQGTAVTIADAINSRVVGCTIRNVSGWAVRIADGTDNGVAGCDIYATGEGGVGLAGGVRATLTPARNFAVNNHIHHYSRICRSTRPAVELSGVGNRAAHNLIHHAPHQAILYSGNDHLIEFNEIHDVCAETGDAGAIYSWGDWSGRGTVIRHNFLHDIKGPGLWGAMGVYIDGMWSGTTVFGNLFQRVDRAVYISGGRDNVVENNVFVDCNPSVYVDARGLGWAWPGLNKRLKQGLEAVPYQSALWSGRYPKLACILEDEPQAPKGNEILRNICQGGRFDQIADAARSYVLMQDNLVDADPRFVAPDKGDFQLRPDSPAFNLGFQRISLEQIGLVKDDTRVSWPVKDPFVPTNAAPGRPN